MTDHQKVLIVDFGSQVTQLIARRLREASVYCEIHPYAKAEAALGYACAALAEVVRAVADGGWNKLTGFSDISRERGGAHADAGDGGGGAIYVAGV